MNSDILIYQNQDGNIKIDVRLQEETVWLTQTQMAQLFGKDKRTISEHIGNVFSEGELDKSSTVRNFRTVQTEGNREIERALDHYNLDVIISVGYRVKSVQGTQFRIWATQRLKEYIIKGFVLNDDRLKSGSSMKISTNCKSVFGKYGCRRNFSTRKSKTSTSPVSTMTRMTKKPLRFSKSFKTNCFGPSVSKPQPNWCTGEWRQVYP